MNNDNHTLAQLLVNIKDCVEPSFDTAELILSCSALKEYISRHKVDTEILTDLNKFSYWDISLPSHTKIDIIVKDIQTLIDRLTPDLK
jgi:tRNA(His) 5'-end guanylyltransferase